MWQQVVDDINQKLDNLTIKRYGLVRDTGDDGTPVPQFTTNLVTFNISEIPIWLWTLMLSYLAHCSDKIYQLVFLEKPIALKC